jgi:hypothetical protein
VNAREDHFVHALSPAATPLLLAVLARRNSLPSDTIVFVP